MRGAKYEKYFVRIMLVIASLAIVAMMVVVAFNIFGRLLFNAPIMGAIELAGLFGAVASAVAIPYAARVKRNVIVGILSERFPPRMKGFFDAFVFLLSFAAVCLMLLAAAKEGFHAASFGEATLVLGVPQAPFKLLWALGLLSLGIILLWDMAQAFRKGVKG